MSLSVPAKHARLLVKGVSHVRIGLQACKKVVISRGFALTSGACLWTASRSAFVRTLHCQHSDDPWLLVPVQRSIEAPSQNGLILKILVFPLTFVTAIYSILHFTLRCAILFIRYVPLGIVYPITHRVERLDELWWKVLLWHLQHSGPTLLKLGQWACTRRDMFSKNFCDRLSVLHTKTKKARLFRQKDEIIRQLFGEKVYEEREAIFPSHHPYSIGSGCIAQVFRVTMDLGQYERVTGRRVPGLEGQKKVEVALKIADPGVEEAIERDLSILRGVAIFAEKVVPNLRFLDLPGALEQFEIVLRRQVDLSNEARALKKFAENFDPKKTGIRFPVVIANTKNAIAETFEEGDYINKLVADEDHNSRQSQATKRRIALMGARALLKMIFVDNFIHGDLHPGNILIRFNDKDAIAGVHRAPPPASLGKRAIEYLRGVFNLRDSPRIAFTDCVQVEDEPTLVLLDTGIVLSETQKNLNNLRALFRAVVEKKGYVAAELLLKYSPKQNCTEPERFCREVDALVLRARNEKSLRTLNISAVLSDLFTIVSDHRVSLDSAFTSVILSVMVLEGFGRSLDPDLDLFQCARPYLLNVMI